MHENTSNEIRFSCPNCQQHISTGSESAGMSAVCPACEKTIIVPIDENGKESLKKKGQTKIGVKPLTIGCALIAVIVATIFVIQNSSKTQMSDKDNPTSITSIFDDRTSDKNEVLGLRGGMSKSEVLSILGVTKLQPEKYHGDHCDPRELWKSPYPGFEAFQYKPSKSFPIEHIYKIRLVFLKDSLQSISYVFDDNPCTITLYQGGDHRIEDNKLHYSRSSSYQEFRGYFRDDLIKDINNVVRGSFDIIDYPLYPDYSTGVYIPKSGIYSLRRNNYTHVDHDYYNDHFTPIFYAASRDIFVRFSRIVSNKDRIVNELSYDLNRPNQISANRNTNEYYLLSFSFKNTYSESLEAARQYENMEAARSAQEDEKKRIDAENKAAEKKANEKQRLQKLKEGI